MKGVTTGVPYALVNAFVVMLVEMHGVMLVVMQGVMLVVMHGVMHGVITAVLQARLRKTAGAPPMWTSHVDLPCGLLRIHLCCPPFIVWCIVCLLGWCLSLTPPPRMYPSSSVLSFLLLSLRSILLPPSYPAFVAFPLCFPSPPYLPYLPPFHLFHHFIDILLPAAHAALPAPAVPLAHYLHGLHSCPLARLQDKRKAVAAASPEYDHSDGPPRAPCVGGQ